MVRRVEVVPYNTDWPSLFKLEADEITAILGQEVVAIHHIGSTAIPRIAAKPIIDVMVEVHDIGKIDRFNNTMVERGYKPKGEFGIAGRRFFIKGGDASRTHHIHMFQSGNTELQRHLDFRDYMIVHPEDAEAYARLKEELARKFPTDIEGYCAGKDGMIEEIDGKAKTCRDGHPNVGAELNHDFDVPTES